MTEKDKLLEQALKTIAITMRALHETSQKHFWDRNSGYEELRLALKAIDKWSDFVKKTGNKDED